MSPKAFTGVRLDSELLEGLQALRERDGAPVSESIRRAVRAYLEQKRIINKTERKRPSSRKRS
jgi:metal-responsive CopG/Arc/MetJ family transcriptional regulator